MGFSAGFCRINWFRQTREHSQPQLGLWSLALMNHQASGKQLEEMWATPALLVATKLWD